MNTCDIIGYVGTGLLTITMLPQVYKTFKTKKANELSWIYLILQFTANILFIFYGFGIESLPVIISNCVVAVCSSALIWAKMCFAEIHDLTETHPLISNEV